MSKIPIIEMTHYMYPSSENGKVLLVFYEILEKEKDPIMIYEPPKPWRQKRIKHELTVQLFKYNNDTLYFFHNKQKTLVEIKNIIPVIQSDKPRIWNDRPSINGYGINLITSESFITDPPGSIVLFYHYRCSICKCVYNKGLVNPLKSRPYKVFIVNSEYRKDFNSEGGDSFLVFYSDGSYYFSNTNFSRVELEKETLGAQFDRYTFVSKREFTDKADHISKGVEYGRIPIFLNRNPGNAKPLSVISGVRITACNYGYEAETMMDETGYISVGIFGRIKVE